MKASHPENDCQEKETFGDSEKDTLWQTRELFTEERERERVGFAGSCITDVLRSRGPDTGSNVVLRDVSASLPALLHRHISPSLKYVPAEFRSDAKIKRDREECNYDRLSRKMRLFEDLGSH